MTTSHDERTAADSPPKRLTIDHWTTIAVTPLPPGWVNVFAEGDTDIVEPCPALLLQEHRCSDVYGEAPFGGLREVVKDPPYDTRVVAAAAPGVAENIRGVDGWFDVACDMGNYLGTDYRPVPTPSADAVTRVLAGISLTPADLSDEQLALVRQHIEGSGGAGA